MAKRNIQIAVPILGEEEFKTVRESISSGWITQGPKVREFEKLFAARHEVQHAFAVTSCTTGLHLALVALGIKAGDEVIVPAFSWVATANVVVHCGAKPVFVDVDTNTNNIAIEQIKEKISDKTKAIIIVHLFGLCVDMELLRDAVPNDINIIEDAACASGASYKGKPAGGLGDVASFSFHPRKSITTGEGGMVTTNSNNLAVVIDQLRNHGASISEEQRHLGSKPYILPEFSMFGYNYRMTDLQGALGLAQLPRLDSFIKERQNKAEFYISHLSNISWLKMPFVHSDYQHGWQSFVVHIDEDCSPLPRNTIMELLQNEGISTRPGTHAIHMLEAYKKYFNLHPDDYPGARDCNNFSMAIPLHNAMQDDDYSYVVEKLIEIDNL